MLKRRYTKKISGLLSIIKKMLPNRRINIIRNDQLGEK